jgi:hypothetical protein
MNWTVPAASLVGKYWFFFQAINDNFQTFLFIFWSAHLQMSEPPNSDLSQLSNSLMFTALPLSNKAATLIIGHLLPKELFSRRSAVLIPDRGCHERWANVIYRLAAGQRSTTHDKFELTCARAPWTFDHECQEIVFNVDFPKMPKSLSWRKNNIFKK